jgi:hypothetical protein
VCMCMCVHGIGVPLHSGRVGPKSHIANPSYSKAKRRRVKESCETDRISSIPLVERPERK